MTDISCQRCAAILAGVRADRLLALLAMLQARGKCTAKELASDLEVSVRTVYRDIEALSAASIPVWGNGWTGWWLPARGGLAQLSAGNQHGRGDGAPCCCRP